jgi:hypothetical protein
MDKQLADDMAIAAIMDHLYRWFGMENPKGAAANGEREYLSWFRNEATGKVTDV